MAARYIKKIDNPYYNSSYVDANDLWKQETVLQTEDIDSIINWELHQKLQKPSKIKTEYDFVRDQKNKEKNKIKNDPKPIQKQNKEEKKGILKKITSIFKK